MQNISSTSKLTFKEWKTEVTRVTMKLINKEPADINDVPYWDLWEKDIDPQQLGTFISSNNVDEKSNLLATIKSIEWYNIIKKTINDIAKNRESI